MELVWQLHREALAPLAEAGKLGAVLFQFPPWFMRSRDNRDYLRSLPERLPGWPLAVEFRGGGWLERRRPPPARSRLLEDAGLAYVGVDEPQGFPNSTPPLAAATAPLAMVRLHGRNAETWESRTGAASDRFKYLYSDAELEEWVPRVRELAAAARRRARPLQQQLRGLGHAERAPHGAPAGGGAPAAADAARARAEARPATAALSPARRAARASARRR